MLSLSEFILSDMDGILQEPGGPGPAVRPGLSHCRAPADAAAPGADRAPWAVFADAARTHQLAGMVNLLSTVPRVIVRLLRDARRGKTRIDLDVKRLDDFGLQLDRTIVRATMGIMTASLVIGSAIVMTVPGGPALFGVPLLTRLGLVGYVVVLQQPVASSASGVREKA